MSQLPDPVRERLSQWKVFGAEHAPLPAQATVDVAIIGSGAGGGITAELLAQAGLSVLVIEEGPLRSSRDFKQRESEAYPELYQEAAARKTADKAINILQGRCVGGSTTVNWTSSFRTPAGTLAFWQRQHGLQGFDVDAMAPWFERAEQRLSISDWSADPNPNNGVLARGMAALGLPAGRIRRNVKGCWNLGSCGMGCPTNAKQSMLVTTIPAALDAGARLYVQTRVQELVHDGRRVQRLICQPVGLAGDAQGQPCEVRARHVVLAGGAINSPALMLRSALPDPYGHLGRRTFLHPVVLSAARFDERIEGWDGAPQTVYSDHFLDTQAIDGPLGFKLEVPPMHPLIMSSTMAGFGQALQGDLAQFPHSQVLLALLRDGFHPDSPGGRVRLRSDGSPELDYPITAALQDGFPPRAAGDGRDPVRRRRARRHAAARAGPALPQLGRGARGHRAVADAALPDARGQRPCDGRLCARAGAGAGRDAARRPPLAAGQPFHPRRQPVPHQHRRQPAAQHLWAGDAAGQRTGAPTPGGLTRPAQARASRQTARASMA
jgi:hypothetical protein